MAIGILIVATKLLFGTGLNILIFNFLKERVTFCTYQHIIAQISQSVLIEFCVLLGIVDLTKLMHI